MEDNKLEYKDFAFYIGCIFKITFKEHIGVSEATEKLLKFQPQDAVKIKAAEDKIKEGFFSDTKSVRLIDLKIGDRIRALDYPEDIFTVYYYKDDVIKAKSPTRVEQIGWVGLGNDTPIQIIKP